MQQLTHIGLDVHKETTAVAVLRPEAVVCDERIIPNTPEAIRRLLSRYRDPSAIATCYEAGPTGYDTHRLVTSLGFDCDVIAPSLIPKRSGVRVKTDRTDARNLARLHRAGELTAIRVPAPFRGGRARPGARTRGDQGRQEDREAEDKESPSSLRQTLSEAHRQAGFPFRGVDACPEIRRALRAGRLRALS